MNQNLSVEDRLEAVGVVLRSRPRLTGRVMEAVRQTATDPPLSDSRALVLPSKRAPGITQRGHRRLLAAGAIAMISAVLLIAITVFPSPSISWAEVTKAIRCKSGFMHRPVPVMVA